MRGPWTITVRKDSSGEHFVATVDTEALSDAAERPGFTKDDAIRQVQEAWSAALHEGFGPADWTIVDETHDAHPA